jgi:hypothetical protein
MRDLVPEMGPQPLDAMDENPLFIGGSQPPSTPTDARPSGTE